MRGAWAPLVWPFLLGSLDFSLFSSVSLYLNAVWLTRGASLLFFFNVAFVISLNFISQACASSREVLYMGGWWRDDDDDRRTHSSGHPWGCAFLGWRVILIKQTLIYQIMTGSTPMSLVSNTHAQFDLVLATEVIKTVIRTLCLLYWTNALNWVFLLVRQVSLSNLQMSLSQCCVRVVPWLMMW